MTEFDWTLMEKEMAATMPTSFGKKALPPPKIGLASYDKSKRSVDKTQAKKSIEKTLATIPSKERKNDQDSDNDDSGVDSDFESDSENLPISHEIVLKDHTRVVTSLALDPAGSRLVTGGRDEYLKCWDFNGMDAKYKPFLTVEKAAGGTPISDLQFSISGDQIMACSGEMQCRIFDRDGNIKNETVKGDPYLRDLRNTNSLTSGQWHPTDKSRFITSSVDSTIRLWDTERCRIKNLSVISVKSHLPGGRSPITCATYSNDGKLILGCVQDGSLHVWSSSGPFIKPTLSLKNSHTEGSGASGVAFARNNQGFVTRGMDDTVKVWDLRNLSKALITLEDIPNFFGETNIVYSPDDKFVITGTSIKKNDPDYGKLLILNSQTLERVKEVKIAPSSSVVRVLWHPRINQIVASSSDYSVHVLYDPLTSIRGAKLCAAKGVKARKADDYDYAAGLILNPPSIEEEFEQMDDYKSKKEERLQRRIEINKRQPELPLNMKGTRGVDTRVVEHMMKTIKKDTTRSEDPREALLKHAEAASNDPYWIDPAYKQNQPAPVFSKRVYENEEEERQAGMKKRRQ